MSQKEQCPVNPQDEPHAGAAGKPSQAVDPWNENPALKAAERIARSWDENPALKAAERIARSWDENPALKAAERIARSWDENPALKAAARIAKSWDGGPALKAAARIAKSWDGGPALKAAAQIAKSWDGGPALKAAAQIAKSWDEPSTQRVLAQFMSPGMLKTFEELQGSPLLHYLKSDGASDLFQIIKAEGRTSVSVKAAGHGRVIKADSALEGEIVSLLSSGGGAESLPNAALTYLREYFRYLVRTMEFLVLIIAVAQAYEYLEGKLDGVRNPEEVRNVISALPDSQRVLLSSYRVLTRDRVILRSSPDKRSDELGRLQIGTPVEVLEVTETWIKVGVEVFGEAKEGWVYRGFTAPIPSHPG